MNNHHGKFSGQYPVSHQQHAISQEQVPIYHQPPAQPYPDRMSPDNAKYAHSSPPLRLSGKFVHQFSNPHDEHHDPNREYRPVANLHNDRARPQYHGDNRGEYSENEAQLPRRRVINVKYYKADPYEGKVPKGEGWVVEPIDGGFRAIKDERALNGWMHIYERAKVIHPSGNSGKTYWYFESIFDPPERVRHIQKRISKDGVQVQDLTPSDSGYFSHIKFDFNHARRAWKDVLPVIPREDETLKEIRDRERAEKVRRMRAYGSYYMQPEGDQGPMPEHNQHVHHNIEAGPELNQHHPDDRYLYNNGQKQPFQEQQWQSNHQAQPTVAHQDLQRYNNENVPQAYQPEPSGYSQERRPYVSHVDMNQLLNTIQHLKENTDSYNVYSNGVRTPWDNYEGGEHRRTQQQQQNPSSSEFFNQKQWQPEQQYGPYDDGKTRFVNENHPRAFVPKQNHQPRMVVPTKHNLGRLRIRLPQPQTHSGYRFTKESLGAGKNKDELWVLRVYGFGYADDETPSNEVLQYDIEHNIGDNSEQFKSYIDSYDTNAVNFALEEKAMSKYDIEKAIEELIDLIFMMSREPKQRPYSSMFHVQRDNKKFDTAPGKYDDDSNKLDTFNTNMDLRKASHNGFTGKSSRTGYGQNYKYGNGGQLDKTGDPKPDNIYGVVKTPDTETGFYSYLANPNNRESKPESKSANLNVGSQSRNENPYDVMVVRKKVVTIEETIDGKKLRKTSDVTETKRIKRNQKPSFAPYLTFLPIPSEIKHQIGKRSVPDFGKHLSFSSTAVFGIFSLSFGFRKCLD